MTGFSDVITMPVEKFRQASGLGLSKVWELIHSGELETVAIGKRRLVIVSSYFELIARRQAENPDARRNTAVPALGTETLLKRKPGRPRKVPALNDRAEA